MKTRYYVIRTTRAGIEYKKAKCCDTWSVSKEGCWKYTLQGATQIAQRLNSMLNPYWIDKIHYNYIKAD